MNKSIQNYRECLKAARLLKKAKIMPSRFTVEQVALILYRQEYFKKADFRGYSRPR